MIWPGFAWLGPNFEIARSGKPGCAPGLKMDKVGEDKLSELPVKRCEPAARRARNSTKPSWLLITVTVKVYRQISTFGVERVGPAVMITLGELVNRERSSMPLSVLALV